MTPTLRLSVIVPCWRDMEELARRLPTLSRLDAIHEIILALAPGEVLPPDLTYLEKVTPVACPELGRGNQLRHALTFATGDVLLFAHADSDIRESHLQAALHALSEDPALAGGAFYREYDERHPRLMWFEPVEARICRSRFGILWGDQAPFIRRETLESIGGYPEQPLMEDVEFSRKLRKAGPVVLLKPPLASSPRRHLQRGRIRASVQNFLIIAAYYLGVSPERLHRWYYGAPKKNGPGIEPAAAKPS